MKQTLKNVFHSPRFLVGFIIFMFILLTVLIYPYFVTRDPLASLGKGFLAPGTYVSVYDANSTGSYRVDLPDAAANRLESTLPNENRQTMLNFLKAKGVDLGDTDTSNDKLADLIALRYRLIPYISKHMKEASEHGTPVMRPMFFDFPEDPVCWTTGDQYMFGDDILFAPISVQGQTERKVWLPEGDWTLTKDGKAYKGGQWITARAEISEFIAFVRAGAEVLDVFR